MAVDEETLRDKAQRTAEEQRAKRNGKHIGDRVPPEDPPYGDPPKTAGDNGAGVMCVRPASEMQVARRKRWLAKSRIPFGDVTVLVGDEGIGKSLFWVWVVAAITTGKALPPFGIPEREPEKVLLILTEDAWDTDVLPRLTQAGAEIDNVSVLCDSPDGSGSPEFPRHMEHVLTADPKPNLVVVDAWLDTVDSRLRVRDGQQARLALHPWRQAATKTGAAVMLLSHTNRLDTGNTRDLYGSTAGLRQKARMTLFAQLADDGVLAIGPDKTNSSQGNIVATAFRIDKVQVYDPTPEDDGTVPKLVYVGQMNKTAKELALANYEAHHSGGDDTDEIPSHLADLAEALKEFIETGEQCPEGRRRTSKDVYKAADACGASADKAKRVKRGIGAVSRHDADADAWYWLIPNTQGGQGV